MARSNTNAELWSALSQFGMMDDSTSSPMSTTLSSSEAEGQTVLSVVITTNGSSHDYFRVGASGNSEVAQIETATTVAITCKSAIAYAHASGEEVVELTRTDLGDVSDDGVQWEVVADRTRIDAATQRHAYGHHINHTEYRVTVALENLSNENMATIMGIKESLNHGAGTAADPTVVDWTPDDIDGIDPLHFWARGTLKNGTTIEMQAWDCDVDPSKTFTIARGQDAPGQIVFNARHIRWLNPAPSNS